MIYVKPMHKLSFLSGLLLLGACTDPRQSCINAALRDLRVVQGLIADLERTVERGYAIEQETDVIIYTDFCPDGTLRDERVRFCDRAAPITKRTPVAVDLDAEQRKLDGLKEKEGELERRASRDLQQCARDFPA